VRAALAVRPEPQRILHVGCSTEALPDGLDGTETRLDIDPSVKPDIVASMTDLGEIGDFDVVYCSHSLEHLYPHEVAKALREFWRVLVRGGFAMIIVPDLEGVRATEEVVYESAAGPICGIDMIYGHRAQMEANPYMAHHCGFVADTLRAALEAAGFDKVITRRSVHDLAGVGLKL